MSELMSPEVLAKLELLGQKLGANSTEVFSWYVTQQYVHVFGIFFIIILSALATFGCKKWYQSVDEKYKLEKAEAEKNDTKKPSEDVSFAPAAVGIVAGLITIFAILAFIYFSVCLINAEYYAFKDLVQTISNMVP